VPSSMLIAPFGARLAHRLPGRDVEAPLCRGADSAGRKDAVESLRVNRRSAFLANGYQRPLESRLPFVEKSRQTFAIIFGLEKSEGCTQFLHR
jgi:hypothetical protein